MYKFIFATLLALVSLGQVQAKDGNYTVAVMVTNPLGMYTKIGGGLEMRYKSSSIVINLVNYSGIYAGKQYRFEYQHYKPTYKKNESFWYAKVCGGDATYDGSKLSLLNDKTNKIYGPVNYIGGGAGVGRRINRNHFFLVMNLGVKYVVLPPDFTDDKNERFRLFYATGPGSLLDCNLRLGFQF